MFNETSSLAYLLGNQLPVGYSSIYELLESNNLSVMEKLWASWYIWVNNDIFATGLLFFLVHEVMYFGRCLPWFIVDRIPYFRRWKIQPTKIPSDREQWECVKAVFKLHLIVEVIPIWLFHPLCAKLNISVQVPFPSWTVMLCQIAVFFFLEDMWHYWFHRLFHFGIFYKYIHKQHHRYAAPFGFAAEYAHPIEVMALGFGTVGFPIIYAYLTKYHYPSFPQLHLYTITLWITLRLFQAVDSHSGYDFPWSLNKFVPFWAGAEHHDEHHHFFIGNYASSFRWFDYVLQTECGTLAKNKREQRMKKLAEYKYKNQ